MAKKGTGMAPPPFDPPSTRWTWQELNEAIENAPDELSKMKAWVVRLGVELEGQRDQNRIAHAALRREKDLRARERRAAITELLAVADAARDLMEWREDPDDTGGSSVEWICISERLRRGLEELQKATESKPILSEAVIKPEGPKLTTRDRILHDMEAARLLVFARSKLEYNERRPVEEWLNDVEVWLDHGCDCERFEGGEHSPLCSSRIATERRRQSNAKRRR